MSELGSWLLERLRAEARGFVALGGAFEGDLGAGFAGVAALLDAAASEIEDLRAMREADACEVEHLRAALDQAEVYISGQPHD